MNEVINTDAIEYIKTQNRIDKERAEEIKKKLEEPIQMSIFDYYGMED